MNSPSCAAALLLLLAYCLLLLPIRHGSAASAAAAAPPSSSSSSLIADDDDDLVFDDALDDESSTGLNITESDVETMLEQQQQMKQQQLKQQQLEDALAREKERGQEQKQERKSKLKKWQRVERLLGMADGIATVGHVFKLHVPKQAFSGSVDYYEARGSNGRGLPHWLRWDEPAGALFGVPARKDMGRHRITIKAYGRTGDVSQDSFFVHVVPEMTEIYGHTDEKKHSCSMDQDRTMLGILLDARYETLKPGSKVNALENLAGFLGLNTRTVSIQPEIERETSSAVVLSGPGSVGRRREKHTTIVQWQVGCDGHFWPHQINVIKQIPEQARDGTLSEVLQLPVYQWRVRSEPNDYARNRRDAAGGGGGDGGSGDGLLPDDEDEEYDEDYEDGDYEDGEGITETPQESLPKQKPPVQPSGGAARAGGSIVVDEHPHRHHHGEDNIAGIGAGLDNEEDFIWRNADLNNAVLNSTTSTTTTTTTPATYTEASAVPARVPSTTSSANVTSGLWGDNSTEEEIPGEPVDPFDRMHVPVYSSTPSTTTSTTTQSTTSTSTTTPSTTTTTTTTTPETTTPVTSTTTTTTMPTTSTSTTTQSTTTSTTTEKIEYGARNTPPKVEKRLKKVPITQGKLLSYTIPEDTFSDAEDGTTRQLRLRIYEKDAPLKSTYWLQFNEETQEVYGLPLEEQYGTYPFEVIAMDSEGLVARDRLDIVVQQHKQIRAVNHEFHIYLKIDKRSEFPTNVDWELKVMRSLAELYGDNDLSYITVRSIDIDNDQAIYTWTNDSLARSSICPQDEIMRLYKALVSDEKSEDPSADLIRVLGPEIRPKRVVYQGLEQCQQTKETQSNKYPIPRNQIDQLNATVGQLFVYTVPQDTFFDEEDGDTRSMKASLLTANRTEIPAWDWLQFDSSNQEFYGVPLKHDMGRKTYQLVVKDREGLEATDSLVAEVHPSPMLRHVVEFSMTLNMPYETFAHSAQKKREFIQRLQKLYGDKNANAISLIDITGKRDTTVVTWRNITLPTYTCPHDEIMRQRRVLIQDDKNFTDEMTREFNHNSQQPEFAVLQITVRQTGACQDLDSRGPEVPPIDDSTSVGASHDDYLITFVLPAIIVAAMLVLAGIIACILYKRRRSGKMSVSEKDDERQSFRSKGIPVIFQDELDEKPDPGNKSPIILKEEKPPLPPPEYQRAEDGADIPMLAKENSEEPYQPPPPFATNRDSNRQNRPKPTPTYRKPPPYVPP